MSKRRHHVEELREVYQQLLDAKKTELAFGSRPSAAITDEIARIQDRKDALDKAPKWYTRLGQCIWRMVKQTWTKPYETLGPQAHSIKAFLQMGVGIWLLYKLVTTLASKHWDISTADPLTIVGTGLLLTTAIELSYLLYTKGPDEAIDPLLTGIAALFLLRAPSTFCRVVMQM